MFGKQAASTSIASPMKDLKIKGGSFDMAGAAGVAGVAIGMLGSAIGKGDGDAATFTKEKKGVLMSSTLKVLVQGPLGTTIMPGIEP
jgi:hypothetical protein